ncbi:sensor histidine kinase [Clostridium lacusfryxellense]|uniref:sensor histidine kinase n=1 Tax=Clostridium lacusfryxellense TaxID=205328 RepID=UPI001C0CD875|nr:HAMP domain-containing sensor histidine kinase [Clostridium lacusfryxellense]MBU3114707.1 HAMP domain-containing histidine kinase [Clostridium lacusfryxellense]
MKLSLSKKLSLGFLLTAIVSIFIAVLISNYMIDEKFNNYLIDEHKNKVEKIATIIDGLYNEKTGFSSSNKDEILRYANAEELYIEVKDATGDVALTSGNSNLQNQTMMGSMMGTMMNNFSSIKPGQYTEDSYPLSKNNKKIGTIVFGYYGTSFLNAGSLTFKMTLNHSFFISGVIALIFGLIVSIFLSKQLSSPLTKITDTANRIRNGDLEARSHVTSKTKEIDDLKASINYLAETLQKQELLRKRLTSDMAHELRTPLTNLKTHIEALLDKVWEPTEKILTSFYEEIERLIKLVEGLNNIAKLEQTNLNLNKSRFNLSLELEEIITSFQPQYSNSALKIYSNLVPNVEVLMDKDKLKQVMYNLLSNSLKYSRGGGEVTLYLKSEVNNITVELKDNGIGISEKDLPFIFERFYRSDESRDKNTGGTGIGLTIVKAIIEAHKGTINVKSKLGEGSTFILVFPKSIIKPDE